MTAEPSYLINARLDIGQRETLGPNDSRFLRAMWKRLGLSWLLGQAWCAGLMADWMQRGGYPVPARAYRALSWATYGERLQGPRQGAIAVLTRKGGGHVGIVTGVTIDGRHVRLLGGNQDDAVKESWVPATRITAYRAPSGVLLMLPEIAKVGEMSKSEA